MLLSELYPQVDQYCHDQTEQESKLLQSLQQETKLTMHAPNMLCGRIEGRFLKMLAKLIGAKRILEIGMYTGYSALSMAEALPAEGTLTTCEINTEAEVLARKYFSKSPHGHKISIQMGPAIETLKSLQGPFDMVFIDADKNNHENYYEQAVHLTRSGGLIIMDNALWGGTVLRPNDSNSKTLDATNRRIAADPRVENVLLPIRDGIHIVRKI